MNQLSNSEIKTILQNAKTIAVVGASEKPDRDSYKIMRFLLDHGYAVFPVNPKFRILQGIRCYPTLFDISEKIDIVDIFRHPDQIPEVVEDAIRIKAKIIWMQLGVFHEAAAKRADEAGLQVISQRCIKVEYLSLIGL